MKYYKLINTKNAMEDERGAVANYRFSGYR